MINLDLLYRLALFGLPSLLQGVFVLRGYAALVLAVIAKR